MMPPPYSLGFVDGVSHWTRNLASFSWAIYTPTHMMIQSTHVCIGPDSNNKDEYTIIINLITNATYHHILHLCIHLDSQLLVSQLNRTYVSHDLVSTTKYKVDINSVNKS